MTSDLCTEDVVVRITTPQIITSQPMAPGGGVAGAGGACGAGGAGGAGPRVAASTAAVELGRRLLLAARAGDTKQVLDLMAKGAPFTTDWLGTSPLHLAAGNGHAATCAVLLRAGVSRDARTKVERTPLHLAAAGGHAAAARALLDAGAAADPRDMLRMTPLHWAVQHAHADTARELLRAGADPAALSKFHKTPLSLAQELRRDDLLRLLEDALKDREAARSVSALVSEQMSDEPPEESHIQTYDSVQRIQDLKPTKIKQTEKAVKRELKNEVETKDTTGATVEGGAGVAGGGAGAGTGSAAALLRQHGITLLPHDDGGTVLSALQSGRTVVLSDAGKLMLKESSEPSPPRPPVTKTTAKGMVLTATPVKSPPKPGVKIFTLNNKLLAVPKDNKIPVKKIINPRDMQVKFVQLPPDAKIISPSKLVPMKAKSRIASRAVPPSVTSLGGQRPAVKIIMNKSNFNRLIANSARGADQRDTEAQAQAASGAAAEHESPSHTAASASASASASAESAASLRAQLAAAQRALASLRRELKTTRARLAHYERLQSL